MKLNSYFSSGFRQTLPVITGVIPFGAVMGTVCAEAGLSFFQTVGMNVVVYAGAAQLASTELMTTHTASTVVVITGLIINLRFLLYSAALSPVLRESRVQTKFAAAYFLTDQSYAVMSANHARLKTKADTIEFYFGTCIAMMLSWHLSVMLGFAFGNFAPASWALDYAVPLSFVALVIPTLKNKTYVVVAAFSSLCSIALYSLPYKTGMIVTAILSIGLGALISRRRVAL